MRGSGVRVTQAAPVFAAQRRRLPRRSSRRERSRANWIARLRLGKPANPARKAEFRRFKPNDLSGVLRLCAEENWASFVNDPGRAARALQAPGVTTIVATERDVLVGFVQLMSDGEIQAHLSLIAVDKAHRRKGIARAMIERALAEGGGERVDLVTDSAEDFYAALSHRRMAGFRIYPAK